MSETPLLDAQRIAEAEALARFGRDSNWIWTIGTLAFSAILSSTMFAFLGMAIEDPEARRAVMWTTTLATIAAYFVERGHMRKRADWATLRETQIVDDEKWKRERNKGEK